MNILTPLGYKDINLVSIGDQIIGYDMVANQPVINTLLSKELYTPNMDGYADNHGDFAMIIINGTISLYKNQSVLTSTMLVHAFELVVGDIIYDDAHNPIIITSLSTVQGTEWWRLEVSGNHSYIADNVLLHNADRYWVGGGSTTDWNALGPTNWSLTSGGANNATAPTSADVARFNGVGASANGTSTISAPITIQALNIEAGFTGTMVHNAVLTVVNNITLGANYIISGTSGIESTSTATLTFNQSWPNSFTFAGGTRTTTLGNSFTIQGLLTINTSTSTVTLNGNILSLQGGLTVSGILTGTTKLALKGGTWSATVATGVANNIDIDGNITISGAVFYKTGTLKYVSGTVTYSSATLTINGSCSLNLNGIATIPQISTNATNTITLVSNLDVTNLNIVNTTTINPTTTQVINLYGNYTNTTTLTLNTTLNCINGLTINSTTTINGVGKINISNGITLNAGLSGSCKVDLNGGTWSQSATTYGLGSNIDINGNIVIGTNATVAGTSNFFTYVSGSPVIAGSTLYFRGSNTTFNTSGITWDNLTFTSTVAISMILASDLNVSGTLTFAGPSTVSGGAFIINANGNLNHNSGAVTLYNQLNCAGTYSINTTNILTIFATLNCNGLLTQTAAATINSTNGSVVNIFAGVTLTNGNISGSAKLIFKSGTWSQSSTSIGISSDLDIDTAGSVTIGANATKTAGTFRVVTGIINPGYTIHLRGTLTFITDTATLENLVVVAATTLNLPVNLYVTNFTFNNTITINSNTASPTQDVYLYGSYNGTGVVTLNTTLHSPNGLTINSTTTINGTGVILITNGITLNAGLSGTCNVKLVGGTWSQSNATIGISNPKELAGSIVIGANATITGGSLTQTNTVNLPVTAGSTLFVRGTNTINTPAMSWGNVSFVATSTNVTLIDAFYINENMSVAASTTISGSFPAFIQVAQNVNINQALTLNCSLESFGVFSINTTQVMTLGSTLDCYGLLTQTALATVNSSNSSVINIYAGITLTNNEFTGTAKLVFRSGTWFQNSTGYGIGSNLDINTASIVTISSNATKSGGTLKYVAGSISANSIINLRGTVNFDTNSLSLYDLTSVTTTTLNLLSNLIVSNTLTANGLTISTANSSSITVGSLVNVVTNASTSNVTFNANGNVNVGTGFTINGVFNCAGTFSINTTTAVTLTNTLNLNGLLTQTASATINSSNGSVVNINAGLTLSNNSLLGTAKLNFNSGTWSQNATTYSVQSNMDILGDVTLGNNATIGGTAGRILKYVSGIVTFGSSTFNIRGDHSLDTSLLGWQNISIVATTALNLISNFNITGTLTSGSNCTVSTSSGSAINLNGALILTANTFTSNTVFNANGGISITSATLTNNAPINGSGNVTLNGSSPVLNVNAVFDCNGNFVTNATSVVTLSNSLNTFGTLIINGSLTANTSNNSVINVSGGITQNNNIFGTSKLNFTSGTWSQGSNTYSLQCNMDINGNVTFGSNVSIGGTSGKILKYLSGIVTFSTTTLFVRGNHSLDVSALPLPSIHNLAAATITLISDLNLQNNLQVPYNLTFTTSTGSSVNNSGTINITGGTLTTNVPFIVTGSTTLTGGVLTITNTFQSSSTLSATSATINNNFANTYNGNITLGSNGLINVNSVLNCNGNFTINSGSTNTLAADLNIYGLLSNGGAAVVNSSNGSVTNVFGGIFLSGNNFTGTAKLILKSGTWSQGAASYGITSNLDIDGNITVSGNVAYSGGTITYISGTPTVTGSTLNIRGNCTINTNGMYWNNLAIIANLSVITCPNNLLLSGTLSLNQNSGVINTGIGSVVETNGINLTGSTSVLSGTAKIILKGGTWSGTVATGLQYVSNNVDIDAGTGTVNLGNLAAFGGTTLTYVSGNMTYTPGSSFIVATSCNFNTTNLSGFINFPNLYAPGSKTITLLSDLSAGLTSASGTFTINKTTNEIINCYGTSGGTADTIINGTADLYLKGGTYSSASRIDKIVYIDGNPVTVTNALSLYSNKLEYLSGDPIGMSFKIHRTSSPTDIDLKSTRIGDLNFQGSTISNILSPFSASTVTLRNNLVNSANPANTISVYGQLLAIPADSGILGGVKSSTKFILKDGSSTQRSISSSALSVDIDIDAGPTGSVFFGYINLYGLPSNPMRVTYVSGTVNYFCGCNPMETCSTKPSGSIIFDMHGVDLGCVYMDSGTYTLLSTFKVSIQLSLTGTSYTFNGTAGWEVESSNGGAFITLRGFPTYSLSYVPIIWTFQAGVTYKFQNVDSSRNWSGAFTWRSSDPVQKANIYLTGFPYGNYFDTRRLNVNFERIDASGGQLIWTHASTVTDCLNIKSYGDKPISRVLN